MNTCKMVNEAISANMQPQPDKPKSKSVETFSKESQTDETITYPGHPGQVAHKGISDNPNSKRLLESMDAATVKQVLSFTDSYLEKEYRSDMKNDRNIETIKTKESLDQERELRKALLEGNIRLSEHEGFLRNMDEKTAKAIGHFVDKYPESDVAKSDLKNEAQQASILNKPSDKNES